MSYTPLTCLCGALGEIESLWREWAHEGPAFTCAVPCHLPQHSHPLKPPSRVLSIERQLVEDSICKFLWQCDKFWGVELHIHPVLWRL